MAITQFTYLFSYLFIYNTAAQLDSDMGPPDHSSPEDCFPPFCCFFLLFLLAHEDKLIWANGQMIGVLGLSGPCEYLHW